MKTLDKRRQQASLGFLLFGQQNRHSQLVSLIYLPHFLGCNPRKDVGLLGGEEELGGGGQARMFSSAWRAGGVD